ncbi:hypothetical protein [Nocardiopsis sp. L17-MgMaSL7]|nr:hypothetical protein [Nocardiopsis sp. L17-MgMaSL7]
MTSTYDAVLNCWDWPLTSTAVTAPPPALTVTDLMLFMLSTHSLATQE